MMAISFYKGPLDGRPMEAGIDGFRDGVAIACARYVQELLTPRGTVLHQEERGTTLLPNLLSGNADPSLVRPYFNAANRQALDNLRAQDSEATDPEIRVQQARLLDFALVDGYLTLDVQITNAAGNTATTTANAPLDRFPAQ